ncbi:MAG: hypothetical protein E7549_03605 [Ruminococcaceae bacterium]|nr:hypothetical protein [Oscillospiraceae bacterium]
MIRSKLTALLHSKERQRLLWQWTRWMFVFLAVEKALSGAVAVYEDRHLHFAFSLHDIDLICIGVYVAVAILITLRVRYTYLLFPDFVLFGVKAYTAAAATVALCKGGMLLTDTLAAVETAAESALFALFLAVLFWGKLSHAHGRITRRYPLYCARLLIACFIVTVVFEVIRCVAAVELHQYPFVVAFNFVKGVLGETLLDAPYYLLLTMLCFVPQKHGEAK